MSHHVLRRHLLMPGLLSSVRQAFAEVPGGVRHRRFSLSDCLMSGLAILILKDSSLRHVSSSTEKDRNENAIPEMPWQLFSEPSWLTVGKTFIDCYTSPGKGSNLRPSSRSRNPVTMSPIVSVVVFRVSRHQPSKNLGGEKLFASACPFVWQDINSTSISHHKKLAGISKVNLAIV